MTVIADWLNKPGSCKYYIAKSAMALLNITNTFEINVPDENCFWGIFVGGGSEAGSNLLGITLLCSSFTRNKVNRLKVPDMKILKN